MTIKQTASTVLLAALTLAPASALAQDNPPHNPSASEILGTTSTAGFQANVPEFTGTADPDDFSLIDAIRIIVNAFLALVALIAVIVIIFAGFRYITSGGDEDAVATAKNQIIFALIGLVIILLSAVIVNFIISFFRAAS